MKRKKFKTACCVVCGLGLLVILGAAGGSDTNTLTFAESAIYAAIGLAMFAGGGYLGGIIQ